jgi:putative CocE/NonD family hydrolase
METTRCGGPPRSRGRRGQPGWSDRRTWAPVQWLAAARDSTVLGAIAPNITASDYHDGWTYQGGAFSLGFVLTWAVTFLGIGEVVARMARGDAEMGELAGLIAAADGISDLFERRPLSDVSFLQRAAPYYAQWLARPRRDAGWRAIAPNEHYDAVTAPSLNMGGWYDLFLRGTIENYLGMRRSGGSAAARRPHLLIGPWSHANATGGFPERDYGLLSNSLFEDIVGRQVKWFDHHLKRRDNGVDREKPVRLFIMGENVWRDFDDWPPENARLKKYYLHSDGGAQTASGDGVLNTDSPLGEPPDVLRHDPRAPVPTVGGATFLPGLQVSANAGPRDQRDVEMRPDVLCFTSEPARRAIEVAGPVELVLYASSSSVDTDFTGKLVDVHPSGRAEILTDGIMRARYRNSLSEPELLEPDRPYEIRIDLGATGNVFMPGHRIRLEIASSNFPRFDVNTGTGREAAADELADGVLTINTVFHDSAHPSHLGLFVVDRD